MNELIHSAYKDYIENNLERKMYSDFPYDFIIQGDIMIQIQMICHFDVEGKIKPMRFQYQDNDENKTININRVVDSTKTKNSQIHFKCVSIIEDFERNYTIFYNIDTCKWYLKMG